MKDEIYLRLFRILTHRKYPENNSNIMELPHWYTNDLVGVPVMELDAHIELLFVDPETYIVNIYGKEALHLMNFSKEISKAFQEDNIGIKEEEY